MPPPRSARATEENDLLDVIIVGDGPAGLSAALVLSRCRRRAIVFDAGHPRNGASHALHGYLTRDGISPAEFRKIGREQLAPYDTIALRHVKVMDVERADGRFTAIEQLRDFRARSSAFPVASDDEQNSANEAGSPQNRWQGH